MKGMKAYADDNSSLTASIHHSPALIMFILLCSVYLTEIHYSGISLPL